MIQILKDIYINKVDGLEVKPLFERFSPLTLVHRMEKKIFNFKRFKNLFFKGNKILLSLVILLSLSLCRLQKLLHME